MSSCDFTPRALSKKWTRMGKIVNTHGKPRKDIRSIIRSKHFIGNTMTSLISRWKAIDVVDWDYSRINKKLKIPPPENIDAVYRVTLIGLQYFVVKHLAIVDGIEPFPYLTVGYRDLLKQGVEGCLTDDKSLHGTLTLRGAKIMIAQHFRSIKDERIEKHEVELKIPRHYGDA